MDVIREPSRRELIQTATTVAIGAFASGAVRAADAPKANQKSQTGGNGLKVAKPEEIRLDPRRLQVAYDLLEKWTTGPEPPVPGGAILVGRFGRIVPPRFFGRQGPERDAEPIRPDAQFLLASITKPIVYLGAMLLVERGRLSLSDRVTRYVPEFAAHGKEETLVLHLFTHTSGLPDMLPNNAELRRQHAPLKTFFESAARDTVPLFRPGTQLRYQSMGTAVVAEIVQRLSGLPIAQFLRQKIFDPLGMDATALGSKGLSRERLVRVQVPDYQAGTDFDWNSAYWQELGAPWGGLFSTPLDFANVCQLMLAGGAGTGVRLLSSAAVRMMSTNRLDDLPDLPEAVRRTQPWGLGWRLNHLGTAESWGDLLGRHVFGHTGATGTMVWMDPQTQGFCIILTSALREKAPWRLVHLSNAVAAAFV
jgi:CubicO group peptidase (beta-lactamase class C family)